MLSVENLVVEIAGVPILRGVSFALHGGKATVLIGRNGAGKTTTLRAIMGLLPCKSGQVSIGGQRIDGEPSHHRARAGIGYAPEDRRLIADFNIEENILLPAMALKMAPDDRTRRLDRVYDLLPELKALRQRPGGGVSGGQGKMVALGRALMVSDRVLMLDEPFQGLAPALARDYARTLIRLRKDRPDIAILVTESSPHLLDALADVTLTIERGTVSEATAEG